METSIFLAQLIGFTYLVMAVSIFIRAKNINNMMRDFEKNPGIMFFASATALVAGLAIILTHNIWDTPWQSLISLFGWLALLKGIFLAIAPGPLFKFSSFLTNEKYTKICGLLMALIAIYLLGNGLAWF